MPSVTVNNARVILNLYFKLNSNNDLLRYKNNSLKLNS